MFNMYIFLLWIGLFRLYFMCNVLYLQCPSDRSLAVEGCDCPSGKPGLPGLPGPMVRHCLTMHPSGLLRPFACYLIKTHIKLFTV